MKMKRDLQYFIDITKSCYPHDKYPDISEECIEYYSKILKAGYDFAKYDNKTDKKNKRFMKFITILIHYIISVIVAFIFIVIAHFIGAPDWGAVLFGVVIASLLDYNKGNDNDDC
jgi:F0F1-type ATP synthase assembly protein I